MKKILYTLGLFCSIFFSACNESTEIEIPEALPTIVDDGADITFTPEQLKLPQKKGVCLKLGSDVNINKLNELGPGWNYTWGWKFDANQPADKEFIPMFWGKNSVTTETLTYLKQEILNGRCKRVLGFNEPDGEKQANMTVEQALELWPQLQSLKVPLGSPAIVDAANGEWLEEFMAGCEERGYRVDFICVHNYGGVGVEAFKTKMQGIIDKYGLPILITEFAVADWQAETVEDHKYTPAQVKTFMEGVLPWLEQNPDVLGYAWFHAGIDSPSGYSAALYDKDNKLTALGEYYRDFTPTTGGDGEGGDEGNEGDENPCDDEGNLVLNYGFESDTENWGGNSGNYSIVTEQPISGNKSLRLKNKSYSSVQQVINVQPNTKYKFGCTGRVAADGGDLQIFIREPDVNSNKYSEVIKTTSTENTHISGVVTIPEGITTVEIIMNTTKNKYVFVDDVYFIEVTE